MSDGPAITIERAGELLHCSRSRVFELIAAGVITHGPRFGRKATVITESVLRAAVTPNAAEALKRPRRARRRRQLAARLAAVPVSTTGS